MDREQRHAVASAHPCLPLLPEHQRKGPLPVRFLGNHPNLSPHSTPLRRMRFRPRAKVPSAAASAVHSTPTAVPCVLALALLLAPGEDADILALLPTRRVQAGGARRLGSINGCVGGVRVRRLQGLRAWLHLALDTGAAPGRDRRNGTDRA
eukprot:scaffold1001_cov334-Prasinococcus_capsulatus_cf.AAC.14